MSKISREVIEAAIEGFEVQKQRLDTQIAELRATLNGDAAPQPAEAPVKKRVFSAAARRRMAAAQQARWAGKNAIKGKGKALAAHA